jgi:hypothetical protein
MQLGALADQLDHVRTIDLARTASEDAGAQLDDDPTIAQHRW